jgi:hypothetical protein
MHLHDRRTVQLSRGLFPICPMHPGVFCCTIRAEQVWFLAVGLILPAPAADL